MRVQLCHFYGGLVKYIDEISALMSNKNAWASLVAARNTESLHFAYIYNLSSERARDCAK